MGDHHVVGLALSDFTNASAQIDGGQVQQIKPIAPRLASFQAADLASRFAVFPLARNSHLLR
jgi:hypothetical protein